MKTAQQAAHTPGPWTASYNGNDDTRIFAESVADSQRCIAKVNTPLNRGLESCANARLIAAAPDLLAALEKSYALLADIRHNWIGRETFAGQALLCSMRDAIANATGVHPCEVSTGNRSEILDAT